VNLKNKILTCPNGQKYYILAGKPTADPKKWIYLFNAMNEDPDCPLNRLGENWDYSLWNVEFIDEHNFRLSPYKGEDSFELEEYLGKEFLEHAFERADNEKNDD